MSDTTALVPVAPSLELTATTPVEMQEAQTHLIQWCEQKIVQMKHDAAELAENVAIAIKRKWKSATLKRHAELASKRVTFYEKIKAALEAGYCIVPNFPVTVFAIRTSREKPLRKLYIGTYKHSGNFTQEAQTLPSGEGEYKDPNPYVQTYSNEKKDSKGNAVTEYQKCATKFDDVEFPINMAKPRIMEATGRAMALKLFDEMGILPDPHPKKDPIIVGRIIDPRPTGYGPRKTITFIVAWHLNVRDI
jgi:hypothetical protein